MSRQKRKKEVAILSVASNSVLVILKLIAGIFIGSVSVLSEAIHSAVDLVAAIIAFFAVKASGKPADERHRYGHGKYENLSAAIEGLLIFLAAGYIIYESVRKLMFPEPVETVTPGIVVMLVSTITNIYVSRRLFKVGKETDSAALIADAWHLRTDVWTSFGVAGGLAVYLLGTTIFPDYNLHWIDPVIALGVAGLIIKAAWELTSESITMLLDVSLPQTEEEIILSVISKERKGVRSFHKLRTRKSGNDRFIEFHLVVDRKLTIEQAHDINDEMTNEIREKLPDATVMIHTEPCLDNCNEICRGYCEKFD